MVYAPALATGPLSGVTVWYDGACPLCLAEISTLRRMDRAGRIAFIDVSEPGSEGQCPLDRAELLARFHARDTDGQLLSGAAAFAAMWRAIPLLRPLGLMARWRPVLGVLEALYKQFLRVRPRLQALARKAVSKA